MKKQIGCVGVLVLSMLFLSSCAYFRSPGPCYGVGCKAFAPVRSAQAARALAQVAQKKNIHPGHPPSTAQTQGN